MQVSPSHCLYFTISILILSLELRSLCAQYAGQEDPPYNTRNTSEMPHNTTSGINRVPLHHLLISHRELVFIYLIINMQPYNLPKQVLKDCLANPAAKGIIAQGLACSASLPSQCTYHTPPQSIHCSRALTIEVHDWVWFESQICTQ